MDQSTNIVVKLTYDEGKTLTITTVIGTTPPGLSGLDIGLILPLSANTDKTVWEVRSTAADVPVRCELLCEMVASTDMEVKATAGASAVSVDVTVVGPLGEVKGQGTTGQTIVLSGFA